VVAWRWATPEKSRRTRCGSVPVSFCPLVFVATGKSPASARQFGDRTRRFSDGEMRIGVAARVGIGDGDAAGLLPGALEHARIVIFVIKRVRHIPVPVRPAVNGDRGDVARAGKASWPQHSVELVPDLGFEIRKGHVEQPCLPDAKLRARIKAAVGGTRNVDEMQAHRLGGIARMTITAEADWKIELHPAVKGHRRGDIVYA